MKAVAQAFWNELLVLAEPGHWRIIGHDQTDWRVRGRTRGERRCASEPFDNMSELLLNYLFFIKPQSSLQKALGARLYNEFKIFCCDIQRRLVLFIIITSMVMGWAARAPLTA